MEKGTYVGPAFMHLIVQRKKKILQDKHRDEYVIPVR